MIRFSVWAVRAGSKDGRRYGPFSYQVAERTKVALLNAHRDDDRTYMFIVKERAR